jgi:hypothetical protein
MLLKAADDKTDDLDALESESDAAYQLDFDLRDSSSCRNVLVKGTPSDLAPG